MRNMKLIAAGMIVCAVLFAGSTGNIHGNAYGQPTAPVVIEVFSDFQCPSCKAFHDEIFPAIMKDYVVPGKVYVVYRYFPLVMHPFAHIAAEYACSAGRIGKYPKVAEALFAQQLPISQNGNVEAAVKGVLTPTELQEVKAHMGDTEVERQIQADQDEGKLVAVTGTPTLRVTHAGRSRAISWPVDYRLFKSYIDTLLAK